MSTFARTKSAKERLDGIDQAQVQAKLQNNDIGAFSRWAREAGREYDEVLGTNYRELAEQAESEDVIDRVDAHYTFSETVAMKRMEMDRPPDGGGVSDDPYAQWFPDQTI